jgi:hypothetical protein
MLRKNSQLRKKLFISLILVITLNNFLMTLSFDMLDRCVDIQHSVLQKHWQQGNISFSMINTHSLASATGLAFTL